MRLAFSAFISFFPIVIATSAGLTSVHPDMLRLARSLTATEWQTFLTVRFPFALPYIFSGMKIAMTFSIIGVIVGEFITSQRGIGYLILLASSKAETDFIFAGLIVLSGMGLTLYGTVALGEWLIKKRYSAI
ncbi:MAG: ABC transporter permease subunit, partial [Gammaproteobacteria bacterium]|nr:ABC transporter permease subunit [Gammaproteobacteria bacterium]